MSIGRLMIGAGLALLLLGAVFLFSERLNLPLGRLPGDFKWQGKRSAVYFPLATCLLLSLVGSLVLWLLNRRS